MPTGKLLEAQTAFTSDSLGSAFVERGPCRQVHFWRHKLPSLSTLWGQRLWKGDLADRYTFGGTNCLHYRLFGVSVCGKGTLRTGTLLEAQTAFTIDSLGSVCGKGTLRTGTLLEAQTAFTIDSLGSVCGKGTLRTGTLLEAQTAFTSDSLGSAFVERGPCRQVHFWRHKLPSLSTLWGQRLWKGDLADRYTFGGTNCLHYRLFGVSLWKGDVEDRYTFGGTNCLH